MSSNLETHRGHARHLFIFTAPYPPPLWSPPHPVLFPIPSLSASSYLYTFPSPLPAPFPSALPSHPHNPKKSSTPSNKLKASSIQITRPGPPAYARIHDK
ncbi:uncharacterized protein BDZ99DRAFT_178713 [Mytilinidion resinicola]|uniref:Uncharacterized protein n=1 Tax=Mytilinidion resinicola TaxID=574789 RepID=A0A6A6Y374_9PEZI|nr:uncharacterized protein BDZ99DRAFT_178713 [Mytilinidion resinicola]KAF2802978.1 hypothetical protein BDZ99DRAFT_178713 [Mytilinidion resinicola]